MSDPRRKMLTMEEMEEMLEERIRQNNKRIVSGCLTSVCCMFWVVLGVELLAPGLSQWNNNKATVSARLTLCYACFGFHSEWQPMVRLQMDNKMIVGALPTLLWCTILVSPAEVSLARALKNHIFTVSVLLAPVWFISWTSLEVQLSALGHSWSQIVIIWKWVPCSPLSWCVSGLRAHAQSIIVRESDDASYSTDDVCFSDAMRRVKCGYAEDGLEKPFKAVLQNTDYIHDTTLIMCMVPQWSYAIIVEHWLYAWYLCAAREVWMARGLARRARRAGSVREARFNGCAQVWAKVVCGSSYWL